MRLSNARTLWNKVLSTYKEVAANALTVKAASTMVEVNDSLMEVPLDILKDAGWQRMEETKKLVDQLGSWDETSKQLLAASDLGGAKEAHDGLVNARQKLVEWVEATLCPDLFDKLKFLEEWATSMIVHKGDTCKEAASAFPASLVVPKELNNSFLLCCFPARII